MCKIIKQENTDDYQECIESKKEYGKGDCNLANLQWDEPRARMRLHPNRPDYVPLSISLCFRRYTWPSSSALGKSLQGFLQRLNIENNKIMKEINLGKYEHFKSKRFSATREPLKLQLTLVLVRVNDRPNFWWTKYVLDAELLTSLEVGITRKATLLAFQCQRQLSPRL